MVRVVLPLGLAMALLAPLAAGAVPKEGTYSGRGEPARPALKECRNLEDQVRDCRPAELRSISFQVDGASVRNLGYRASWTCTRMVRDMSRARGLPRSLRLSRSGRFSFVREDEFTRRGITRTSGAIIKGRVRGSRASGTFRQYFSSAPGARCDTGTQKWTARLGGSRR